MINETNTATGIIICPACERQQQATATQLGIEPWAYVHRCECGYVIMESEWEAAGE